MTWRSKRGIIDSLDNKAEQLKKIADNIPIEILTKDYLELNSSYKVAKKHKVSATAVKRLLKKAGVLRTQNEAASIRNKNNPFYVKRLHNKKVWSKISESRKGQPANFKGRQHTESAKVKIGLASKKRAGKRNPNYKHGKYIRRPRDFKLSKLTPLRNEAFNRDKYTCYYCKEQGGYLHAHHIIPYWVRPEAFLDVDNLCTVCTKCHFTKAHKSNWQCFDADLVTNKLIGKYSIDRERLSDLASFSNKKKMR